MSTGTAPKTVHTFCRYCLAACGIEVTVEGNHITKIAADKQHRESARRTPAPDPQPDAPRR